MREPLKVVLIADGWGGVEAVRMLAGTPHQIVAVMTRGAGSSAGGATVAGVAGRLGHPLWPAEQAREARFAGVIKARRVDLILSVQSSYVLPQEVVASPRIGSFNLHPGPLPRYPSLTAPNWAVYHGRRSHAVTLHWMDAAVNAGPVAFRIDFPIEEDETGLTLSAKCTRAGLPLLHDLLAAAVKQEVPRIPQRGTIRRHYGAKVPHEGRLIWSDSAARIVSFVRACDYFPFVSPWGSPRAYLGGREVVVLKAARTGETRDALPGTIGPRVGSAVLVAARDQWVTVQRVRVGSSSFPAVEVLREGERFAVPRPSQPVPAL
jgi:methionyl-tRNA formyltransferase